MRTQLAIVGSIIVICVLSILLAAVVRTSTTEVISTDLVTDVEETSAQPVPTSVVWIAAALAIASLGAMWWWAERAVRPIRTVADAADAIRSTSLDRRIEIDDAPQEVQTLIDSFNSMLARLQAASAQQQQLIEDTSHELRNPLAALAVSLELAADDHDPSNGRHRANARESLAIVEQLSATVADLLETARRNNHRIAHVDTDLVRLAEEVVQRHRLLHPTIVFRLDAPRQLPLGAPAREIERALDNLVSNAARASDPGSDVVLALHQTPDGIMISVTDDGPGIAPERHSRIFERYETARDSDGTGIGLALVKAIADATGSISVNSPISNGRGTRFEWTIAHRSTEADSSSAASE